MNDFKGAVSIRLVDSSRNLSMMLGQYFKTFPYMCSLPNVGTLEPTNSLVSRRRQKGEVWCNQFEQQRQALNKDREECHDADFRLSIPAACHSRLTAFFGHTGYWSLRTCKWFACFCCWWWRSILQVGNIRIVWMTINIRIYIYAIHVHLYKDAQMHIHTHVHMIYIYRNKLVLMYVCIHKKISL